MSFINSICRNYVDNLDERVASWFLVDSTFTVLSMFVGYIIFVFYLGPRYMQNRKPYSLKGFIQCYDIFQVLVNSYIVYGFIDGGWYNDIWFNCVPFTYNTDPKSMKIASTIWLCMIIKFVDFIETIIYVLRKKNEQISGLHIYHHISTALIGWLGTRYFASGMACVVPIVNCGVHVIMYTYYYLASLGPNVLKIILPYKPLLTIVQMTQFVALMLYCMQPFTTSCPVSKVLSFVMIGNFIINFYLFYDFYQTSYKSRKTKRK